jgi:hypothetical protein
MATNSSDGRQSSLADLARDLDYADWRDEILNLASTTEPLYLSWWQPDGTRRLAVLRGACFSAVPTEGSDHGLARAMLADALGTTQKDASDWAERWADDFVHEVLKPRLAVTFELPVRDVAAWVLRRSLSLLGDRGRED